MTKLENPQQITDLLNVFDVDSPTNLPLRVQETIDYLKEGLLWAKRHQPECFEGDAQDCLQILGRLKKTFEKCLELPERGMIMRDNREGYQVNVFPIIAFLKFTETEGTVFRNFDVIQTLLRCYIHADNMIAYKKVGQFIQDIETALYDYQN